VCKNFSGNERSVLYNLCPMGLGTAMVESFTSYLTRIAKEHNTTVGYLVNKLLIPTMNKDYLSRSSNFGGNRFYEGAKTLNGYMGYANQLVTVTNKLTGREDLQELTLLNWKEIFPLRGLLKDSLSWCPYCIEGWLEDGKSAYYPLIWYLKSINTCDIHSCYLRTTCPSCKKEQDILRRQSLIGVCHHCFQRLDEDSNSALIIQEGQERHRFFIRNISSLLVYDKEISLNKKLELVENLNRINDEVFGGNVTNLSKHLIFAKNTVSGWLKGDANPTLENQIYLCYRLNLEIQYLLFNTLDISKIGILEHKESKVTSDTQDKVKLDYNFIERRLEEILQNEEVISMAAAAEKIGVSKRMLYRNFRALCMRISNRYKHYIEKRKTQRITELKSKIEESFLVLYMQGIYPSRRKMEYSINRPGLLKERELQLYWKGLLSQYGLSTISVLKEGESNGNEYNGV
jgi:transcriptional regulator with XRE-family HTH domain